MKLRVINSKKNNPDPIVDIWIERNEHGEILLQYAIEGEAAGVFALITADQTEFVTYERDLRAIGLKLIKS